MDRSEVDEKFFRGVEFFNSRRFFEAHEAWEEIWLAAAEPDKAYLQGIIQIAAAFHHYVRGNKRGTQSLLEGAARRLASCPPTYCGIALDELRSSAQQWREAVSAGLEPDFAGIPVIRVEKSGEPTNRVR